jgi:hypothetical protein
VKFGAVLRVSYAGNRLHTTASWNTPYTSKGDFELNVHFEM